MKEPLYIGVGIPQNFMPSGCINVKTWPHWFEPIGIANIALSLAQGSQHYINLKTGQFVALLAKATMRQHLFLEDIEDAGLSRLEPLNNLEEETATTASVDFSYTIDSIETSLTLFDSDIEKVTKLEETGCISCDKTVRIVNAQGLSEIRGVNYYFAFVGMI